MTESSFQDHFSSHAADYQRFRPNYPNDLFGWLATLVRDPRRAWDCATGNGQAAVALAGHFDAVIATDASSQQIASAKSHPRVRYQVARASSSGLDALSIDLVTVAQALHWFDVAAFQAEVKRVVRPGGVAAAWCYKLFTVSEAFDRVMHRLYFEILGADWPPERRHVENGYRDLDWPWIALDPPTFEMTADWRLDQVLGYLRTWSASQRWTERTRSDALGAVETELRVAWGNATTRRIRWPLQLIVSRLPSD